MRLLAMLRHKNPYLGRRASYRAFSSVRSSLLSLDVDEAGGAMLLFSSGIELRIIL
jgi:hypothetical protein